MTLKGHEVIPLPYFQVLGTASSQKLVKICGMNRQEWVGKAPWKPSPTPGKTTPPPRISLQAQRGVGNSKALFPGKGEKSDWSAVGA